MLQDFISSCPLKLRRQRLLLPQRPLSTSPLAAPGRLCTHQLIDWRGGWGRERERKGRLEMRTEIHPYFLNLTGEILQLSATLTPNPFLFSVPWMKEHRLLSGLTTMQQCSATHPGKISLYKKAEIPISSLTVLPINQNALQPRDKLGSKQGGETDSGKNTALLAEVEMEAAEADDRAWILNYVIKKYIHEMLCTS